MTVKSGRSLSGLGRTGRYSSCIWQVEGDFAVLQNKNNNDHIICSLKGVFLHDEVSAAC